MKELWIARNEDVKLKEHILQKGTLYISVNKPVMQDDQLHKWWCATGEYGYLPSCLFPEVSFENSPKKIRIELI